MVHRSVGIIQYLYLHTLAKIHELWAKTRDVLTRTFQRLVVVKKFFFDRRNFLTFSKKELEKYALFKIKKLFPRGTFLFATYKYVLPFTEGEKVG